MHQFRYYVPTEIIFGRNTELEAGKEIRKRNGTKAIIVYGSESASKSGLLGRVKKSLEDANVAYVLFGGVQPNPRLSHAEDGIRLAMKENVDFVLAVGGGSVIDTAKAISMGVGCKTDDIWDIWTLKAPYTAKLPLGSILTISAAGSETSDSAVLTNEAIGKKAGINTPFNRPEFAIMNPELTFSLPKYQIACGIADIMMHTFERYLYPNTGNQMTDEIAEGLLRTVIKNGEIAYQNPTDYESMSELMWAGSLSHSDITGLGHTKDFCIHKFGHTLGAKFDKAHGATLSAVFGAYAEMEIEEDPTRFAQYGRKVWNIEDKDDSIVAKKAIEKTLAFFKKIEVPINLIELLGKKATDEEIEAMAIDTSINGTAQLQKAKKLSLEDVAWIYRRANEE